MDNEKVCYCCGASEEYPDQDDIYWVEVGNFSMCTLCQESLTKSGMIDEFTEEEK